MPTESPTLEHVDVRDLTDKQPVDQVFVVRDSERRTKKDGGSYLRVVLGDRTGSVEAVAWEEVERLSQELAVGAFARISGTYEVRDKYGPQVKIGERGGRVLARVALPDEFDPDTLVIGPRIPVDDLESHLHELVTSITEPNLARLVANVLYASDFYAAFREAPAARNVHQAYTHGLLEHTVTVAQTVSTVATGGTFGPVNRDLAVAGALLHDIGKLDVYTRGLPAIETTSVGKLHGEIPLTYYKVRQAIEANRDFPGDLADALLHIIVSHHGRLEWGSAVVPCTREAALVHAVDALGANFGSFDRLETELPSGDEWSGYDRPLGARAWFGPVQAPLDVPTNSDQGGS